MIAPTVDGSVYGDVPRVDFFDTVQPYSRRRGGVVVPGSDPNITFHDGSLLLYHDGSFIVFHDYANPEKNIYSEIPRTSFAGSADL
jgi:hypothetical protein